jgi:signal transduction histidine kinase
VYHNSFSSLRLSLSLALILSFSFALAQEKSTVDSLKNTLDHAVGSAKFDVLLELFIIYSPNNYEEALYYAEEAYQAALALGDSVSIIKGGRMKSNVLTSMGKNDESIEVLNQILPIAKRNGLDKQVIYILNSLGFSHTYRGSYDKALEYHFQSLVLREKDGDQGAVSISLINIGLVYYKLKDFEKALDYYRRALDIKRSINDKYGMDKLYANMGLCFNQLEKYQDAIKSFNSIFELCGNECSEDIKKEVFNGLGMAYYGMKDYVLSEENLMRSLNLAKQSSDNRFQFENLILLSKIKIAQDRNMDIALMDLKEAQMLAEKTDYVEPLIDIYKILSVIYTKMEDFQSASNYQSKYIHLKDSIYSENLINNLTQVQTKFEERKNIQTIADKEEALSRQRLLNVAIAVIAILSASLVFVLYRSNLVTRRVNKALSEAKSTIEAQNKELTKAKTGLEEEVNRQTKELKIANESLKRVNEELDNFIYKTSHDIRGPLASLKGICNVAIMDVKDPMALDYLKKLDETAGRLNSILTRLLIINQINHASLLNENIDFEDIVNDVILLEKKRGLPSRLKIECNIESPIKFYSDASLLRIILENLIDNAIKFYNDSDRIDPFVHIRIAQEDGKIGIYVTDNGIGVTEADPDKIFQMFSRASERSGTGGIGLYLSKLATEKLGGEINFRTTPEKQTEFFALFPNAIMA